MKRWMTLLMSFSALHSCCFLELRVNKHAWNLKYYSLNMLYNKIELGKIIYSSSLYTCICLDVQNQTLPPWIKTYILLGCSLDEVLPE